MKSDKSKSQSFKFNPNTDTLKKEITLQREAAKKYQKFKKSASQPAYFLDKSRLKKISDIYRVMSLQKLSKNNSLNKSKSLHHNTVTPQKKPSFSNNLSFKKQPPMNTLNLNKAFDTNEKTKRLRLDKTVQSNANHTIETSGQTATKFLVNQVDKLQEITNMTIEKVFVGQYEHFFKSLKEECFSRKGYNCEIKTLVSKFCYLMELCQQKLIKLNEKDLKTRYNKIEQDFSQTTTQLKKKSFKMQLLIKEIDQLKVHNMKIAKQLYDLKEQKKTGFGSNKNICSKRHLQITNMFEMKIHQHQAEITTPIYHYQYNNKSDESLNEFNQLKEGWNQNQNQNQDQLQNHMGNENVNIQRQTQKIQSNQKLQMIKRIRVLQKKQKDLVKTLLVLKSDGIDVQRAFHQVSSGQADDIELEQSTLKLTRQHTPSYIRKMNNNNSYDADSSVVESIDGLTVRYLEGQPQEEYIFYPIKNEYKSKPLNQVMQNKLKLNFDVLYEDYECADQSENSEEEELEECSMPPTI